MKSPTRHSFFPTVKYGAIWLGLLIAVVGLHQLADRAERSATTTSGAGKSAVFPSLPLIENVRLLGWNRAVADFYWLAFVQYAGDGKARREDKWKYAGDYLNVITAFDPQFVTAYWYAAFTVGADQRRPELAALLLDRGIAANPNNWYLPYIAAVNQLLYAHDDKSALMYDDMAASMPGAPAYISEQAKILRSGAAASLVKARAWQSIYDHCADPQVASRAYAAAVDAWLEVLDTAPTADYRQAAQQALTRLRSGGAAP